MYNFIVEEILGIFAVLICIGLLLEKLNIKIPILKLPTHWSESKKDRFWIILVLSIFIIIFLWMNSYTNKYVKNHPDLYPIDTIEVIE
jgi:hypothetical protein